MWRGKGEQARERNGLKIQSLNINFHSEKQAVKRTARFLFPRLTVV